MQEETGEETDRERGRETDSNKKRKKKQSEISRARDSNREIERNK